MSKTSEEYIERIGIIPARDEIDFSDKLIGILGPDKAKMYIDLLVEGRRFFNEEHVYSTKNREEEISVFISGLCFYDYYIKAFDWIDNNKNYFVGKTILEIGCDCGIVSCYLAQLFPDKTIVAIDRNQKAISVASSFAKRLGYNNIVFRWESTTSLSEKIETFDTVFAMNLIYENRSPILREDNKAYIHSSVSDQIKKQKEKMSDYSKELSSLVKTKGNLILVEDLNQALQLYAICQEVVDNGFVVGESGFTDCKILGNAVPLLYLVFENGRIKNNVCLDVLFKEILFNSYGDRDDIKIYHQIAELYYYFFADDIITGYEVYISNTLATYFKIAKSKLDEKLCYTYSFDSGGLYLEICPVTSVDLLMQRQEFVLKGLKSRFDKLGAEVFIERY